MEQKRLKKIVDALSQENSYKLVFHRSRHDEPMPSVEELSNIMEMLRAVLFPGYFGSSEVKPKTMKYFIGSTLDNLSRTLSEQIQRGFCCLCKRETGCDLCRLKSSQITINFLSSLPKIRKMLCADVNAGFGGDPAAKNPAEIIFCYPSIKALTSFRIAHELHMSNVPLIPRIITELAHSETGIDIHPGAKIGESFFMDHGTGIVIGETAIIGNNVRIYQGVTLGAKDFPKDKRNILIKGIPRHPIVEDDVIIYSGATILGRITIGKGSVIGGNVWITNNVPPYSSIAQEKPHKIIRRKNEKRS